MIVNRRFLSGVACAALCLFCVWAPGVSAEESKEQPPAKGWIDPAAEPASRKNSTAILQSGSQVRVRLISGETFYGVLRQWDNDGLRLETEAGEMIFKSDHVDGAVPWTGRVPPAGRSGERAAGPGFQGNTRLRAFFLETSFLLGFGLKGIKVAKTKDGDNVKISGGGGLGGMLGVGYGVTERIDALLSLGVQSSSLVPRLNNATAAFNRRFLLLTSRYKFRFGYGAFRLGGGVGLYQAGRLKLNLGGLGDADYDMRYSDAVGVHAGLDYEAPLGRWASLCMGAKYTAVSYEINSLTINGVPYATRYLVSEFRTFRGDSVDLMLGLKF